jgi:hypothetical protein
MKLTFCFNINNSSVKCYALPSQSSLDSLDYYTTEPLHRLFPLTEGDNLPFYQNFLSEISEIENGNKETFEDRYDVGGGLMFELKITKETTYCETWTDVRKCLELPTSEFKELVENWIKFVEVNTVAFGSKNG